MLCVDRVRGAHQYSICMHSDVQGSIWKVVLCYTWHSVHPMSFNLSVYLVTLLHDLWQLHMHAVPSNDTVQ